MVCEKVEECSRDDTHLKFGRLLANPIPSEAIVISGISGAFPSARNIDEFRHMLMSKTDMITPTHRPGFNHPDMPARNGTLPEDIMPKCDAGYFGMHRRMPDHCNPGSRIQFERIIEAIHDAGMSPKDFENTNTGHFMGMCINEKEHGFYNSGPNMKLMFKGIVKALIASSVSHHLKMRGPILLCDTACSTSLHALDHAYRAIRQGECDAALVTSINICLCPGSTLQFAWLGVLSPEGVCSAFDESGNGYVRSEAVCAVLLQKAKDAKRIYAQVLHSKCNSDGFKEQGITFPNAETQHRLMDECCRESDIGPDDIIFMEAHGTGTKAGDPEELNAIDMHLGQKRKKPLLVGSVKSSIGHSESAAGLCSIIKALLALEEGSISPNIHFKKPRNVPGILEGRMKVVTEQTKLPNQHGIMGVNSFGFGGSNCHVLLKSISKMKVNGGKPTDNLPRLVCVSGRTKEGVFSLLGTVSEEPLDAELVRLLQNSFSKDIATHMFRGFSIVTKEKELQRSVARLSSEKLTLSLVFGELNDWYSLATECSEVPIYQKSLRKIAGYFEKKGLNLFGTILNTDPEIRGPYERIGNLLISICIADILKQLSLKPDSVTGYCIGNLICAYYDDRISITQLLDCILKNEHIPSSTQIISEQKGKNRIAESDSTNQMNNGILQDNCNGDAMLYFREEKKPKLSNLQMIEIQVGERLDRNLCEENAKILSFQTFTEFLSTIGRLYELGFTLPIEKLFPEVEFPVSRGTPMISSKIKWNHERQWEVRVNQKSNNQSVNDYNISLKSKEWSFISGHMIDGRVLFPAAGYLWLARDSLLKKMNIVIPDTPLSLSFKNCRFIRATQLSVDSSLILTVSICDSGYFEIVEKDSLIVSGEIYVIDDTSNLQTMAVPRDQSGIMKSADVYKELRLRGYNYSGEFQCIREVNLEGTKAQISWNNKWITFIDNVFQMIIVHSDTRLLYVPTSISELIICPSMHRKVIKSLAPNTENLEESSDICLPAYFDPETNTIRSGGLKVTNLLATSIKRRKYLASPVLERYQFVPNITTLSFPDSVRVNAQIILENSLSNKVKAVELIDEDTSPDSDMTSPILRDVLGDQPLIIADITILSKTSLESSMPVENKQLSEQNNLTLVIASKLLQNPKKLQEALNAVKDEGYIMSKESPEFNYDTVIQDKMSILTVHKSTKETLILLKKQSKKNPVATSISINDDENRHWLEKVKSASSSNEEVILFSHKNELSGLLGLVNCLRREPGGQNIKCVLILDNSLEFDPEAKWCKDQLEKQMAINIYRNGTWGTYRHLNLEITEQVPHNHSYVNQLVKGDLSSLVWLEGAFSHNMASTSTKSNFIKIHYAALNFRDVMVASGKISLDEMGSHRQDQECVLGFEFSGKDSSGQKVMGMISQGALATAVLADKNLIWKVPQDWSLADAATVPVVYGTVIYALTMRGQMVRGDSILIHSGTGGIGQAAIRYALYHGCTVYTTVGNEKKKEFLKTVFPQLKDENIGNSHDQSFETMVRKRTGGRGVDIVLNSLAEDKLMASVRCLAAGGRFLEIGKFDILMNKPLCTLLLQKEASFHGIMLDRIFDAEPYQKSMLGRLISDGIRNESIKPLSMNIFKCDEVEQAFRFMAGGKHMGKVLINVHGDGASARPEQPQIVSIPRYYCQPNESYLIVGGLGGFGLELVDWLIMRGARKLVLSSRTGTRTGYQKSRLRIWKSYGIEINICTADIATKQGCKTLLEEANNLGPVAAVFNLAVILRDALFENQTEEMFEVSLAPKAGATEYLDELTREMCPRLSKFVVFSSVSCGRGNPGQTNYGMANSIMERICERRRRDGYPALAIQWGAIGEVGLVADMQENHQELEISGTLQQRLQSCMEVLDDFLTQDNATIVSSMVVAEKKVASSGEDIIGAIAAILGINDIKSVSIHTSLPELGMDSMNAVEIKQILERDLELFLTPKETRTLTFAKLMEINEARLKHGADMSKSTPDTLLEGGLHNIIGTIPDENDNLEVFLKMTSRLKEDEEGPTIFMIPGIEGFSKSMTVLASNLNAHVICFQYDYQNPIGTIAELKDIYIKYMEQFLTKSNSFYIIAHSYGAVIAVEMISVLEARGFTGIFVSIDGGPTMMPGMTAYLSETDTELETEVICQMMLHYLPYKTVESHVEEIMACATLKERTEKSADIFRNALPYSREMIAAVFNGIIARLKALREHTPTKTSMHSRVILCIPTATSKEAQTDHGLSEICGKQVESLQFDGNHLSILQNFQLAVTINSLLDVVA